MSEELFDKYLSGTLDADEARELARRLKEDPAVGEAMVRHVRETALFIQVASQLQARPAARKPSRLRRPLLAAAAVALAAAIGVFLFPGETPVAEVVGARGDVRRDGGSIAAGATLTPGQRLDTGSDGTAALRFEDGTRVDLGPGTQIRDVAAAGGKRMRVVQGKVKADVVRQPANEPMSIGTPQGSVVVLGTRFALTVSASSTRLEVEKGMVRLTKEAESKSVDVGAGQVAVAAPGTPLRVQSSIVNSWVEVTASYDPPPGGGRHFPIGGGKAVYDSTAGRVLLVDRWYDPVRLDSPYANAVLEFRPVSRKAALVKIGNWKKLPAATVEMAENAADPTPCDRQPHGAVAYVALQNALYLVNGANQTAPKGHDSVRDTWKLDLSTRRWSRINSALQPPNELDDCMAYDDAERKLVYFAHAAANEPQTWVMDVQAGQWTQVRPATQPPGRMGGVMAYDPVRKRSLLLGGGPYPAPGRELWAYDAKSNSWSRLADAPVEMRSAGFAYGPRHDVFLAAFGPRTFVYDPRANRWSELQAPAGAEWPSVGNGTLAHDAADDLFVVQGGTWEGARWFVFRYER